MHKYKNVYFFPLFKKWMENWPQNYTLLNRKNGVRGWSRASSCEGGVGSTSHTVFLFIRVQSLSCYATSVDSLIIQFRLQPFKIPLVVLEHWVSVHIAQIWRYTNRQTDCLYTTKSVQCALLLNVQGQLSVYGKLMPTDCSGLCQMIEHSPTLVCLNCLY